MRTARLCLKAVFSLCSRKVHAESGLLRKLQVVRGVEGRQSEQQRSRVQGAEAGFHRHLPGNCDGHLPQDHPGQGNTLLQTQRQDNRVFFFNKQKQNLYFINYRMCFPFSLLTSMAATSSCLLDVAEKRKKKDLNMQRAGSRFECGT